MASLGMVKACHSCKEYVILDASYESQKLERAFDSKHRGHMVQVVQFNEVKEKYKKFEL
ncbi:MAG: hypothetical protein ACTSPY_09425 [Candidatus Helarchaeota archaeon]